MAKSLLFSCTLLISSALVFLIEFTCAKMVLPLLGGAPAVWNTCLVFFQAGLLLGYGYAHLAPIWLGVRRHALIHLALWLLAGYFLLMMPFEPASAGKPPGEPIFWLLRLLAISVGFPFVLLSSCGPLVQRWFASTSVQENPYFLYTASNLGSLLGLVLFPFVIEPHLSLAEQYQTWTWIFICLAVLLAACGCWGIGNRESRVANRESRVGNRESGTGPSSPTPDSPLPTPPSSPTPDSLFPTPYSLRFRWVLLALAPSSLMLSATSYLTTDIAPIPLLWMLPMGLYLGSFVLVFTWQNLKVQAMLARWLPAVLLLVLIVPMAEGTEPIWLVMAIHLFGFLWIAIVCHSELARSKPPVRHLTEFYLWLAVGGVLGGMVNALAAPLLFNGIIEYPLMLVLVAWLNPGEENVRANLPGRLERPSSRFDLIAPVLVGLLTAGLVLVIGALMPADRFSAVLMFFPPGFLCLLAVAHPARFSLCLAAMLLASSLYGGVHGKPILQIRSFFGVHRVTEFIDDDGQHYHKLIHGNTTHGMQHLDPELRGEPLTYYHKKGPIGEFFMKLKKKNDSRLERVGVIGLGTGALACYSEPRQRWTFFEIDPAVIRIARDRRLFTYLSDHDEQVEVISGDARLTLEHGESASGALPPLTREARQDSNDKFGVLVVDAFGSDSIPLHLLTREALAVYQKRLRPGGVIAFHISNRYFDLEPILANLAREAGWTCKIRVGQEDLKVQCYASIWVLMAESPRDLEDLVPSSDARGDPTLQPWTDDFSNVLQILK
jgi:SAM-dependent methyltransferase